MVPDGAITWQGGLNKDVTVTLDAEGVYGARCIPHYGMGMVALIVVGDPLINLETAGQIKHPGKAKQRMIGTIGSNRLARDARNMSL